MHTVKNFYGDKFDASRYLNKFFDLTIKLNDIDTNRYIEYVGDYQNDGDFFYEMVYNIAQYYNFSMRDCNRYIQITRELHEQVSRYKSFDSILPCCIILFVPIVFGLRIFNVELSEQFEKGNNFNELKKILDTSSLTRYIFDHFISIINRDKDVDTISKIDILYKELFSNESSNSIIDLRTKRIFWKLITVKKLGN